MYINKIVLRIYLFTILCSLNRALKWWGSGEVEFHDRFFYTEECKSKKLVESLSTKGYTHFSITFCIFAFQLKIILAI